MLCQFHLSECHLSWFLQEELVQLSRLGVVQGLGEVVGEDSEEKDTEESGNNIAFC